MQKILCYIYDEMADFEISLLLHRLKNAGKREIVSVSEDLKPFEAQSGLQYLPSMKISDIDSIDEFEALIIPGGPIDNEQNAICPVINKMIEAGRLVAAICFAPQFPGRAGVLNSYRYTTSCSFEKIRQLGCTDPFNRENYVEKRCVSDRNLITAKGYAFVDFAEAVCDYLHIFESEQQRYEQFGLIRAQE